MAHTGIESPVLALAPDSDQLSYICIYVNSYLHMSYLKIRLHINYTVNFLCFHSLFAYSYIGFQSLYNKDITLNIWCVYFPEVPFLLRFSEHIPLQVLLLFIDGMSCVKETQPSLS